jgi:hypothetical protein
LLFRIKDFAAFEYFFLLFRGRVFAFGLGVLNVRSKALTKKSELMIYTIGHSTRTLDEFVELLKAYAITLLVDVRTVPRSRHNPQFNKETLPSSLKPSGVKQIHMPEIVGCNAF